MWFGTWNGLNRYGGYKFKVFKHEPGNPKSLSGVYVYSLFKDHSGNLWVGTDGFLDRFRPETESFIHYKLDKPSTNGLSSIVTDISEDSGGKLWLSTRNGLFRLDPNSGDLKKFVHDPADPLTLGDSNIRSTGEDRKGNFWVATKTFSMYTHHPEGPTSISDDHVNACFSIARGPFGLELRTALTSSIRQPLRSRVTISGMAYLAVL
jgi:ligand-binding sensor domain-containing protein